MQRNVPIGICFSSECFVPAQNDFLGCPEDQEITLRPPLKYSSTNPCSISPWHFGQICGFIVVFGFESVRNRKCLNTPDSSGSAPQILQPSGLDNSIFYVVLLPIVSGKDRSKFCVYRELSICRLPFQSWTSRCVDQSASRTRRGLV